MTLLAHAIAAAPPAPLSHEGLRGRPLAWSEAGDLGLWSTEWAPDIKLERPDALEHHRLVERICAAQPCLPVRFGTAFASSDDARASLDKRAAALHAALALRRPGGAARTRGVDGRTPHHRAGYRAPARLA